MKNPNPGDVSYADGGGFDWGNVISTVISTGSNVINQTQAQKTAQANASAALQTSQAAQAAQTASQQALLEKIALLNNPTAQTSSSGTQMYIIIGVAVVAVIAIVALIVKKS